VGLFLSVCLATRAFQFWSKSFDAIRFGNLINLPDTDGEFGEGPGGVSLSCGSKRLKYKIPQTMTIAFFR